MRVRAIVVPKTDGDHCEDSFSFGSSDTIDQIVTGAATPANGAITARTFVEGSRVRLALSDGATEYSWSRLWAGLLTKAFVERRLPCQSRGFVDAVVSVAEEWWSITQERVRGASSFVVGKWEDGSYATFLGVEIDVRRGLWSAVGVGDTWLFVGARGKATDTMVPWPMPSSPRSHYFTRLIPTAPTELAAATVEERTEAFPRSGGSLLLATDAVGRYLCRDPVYPDQLEDLVESGSSSVESLRALRDRGTIEEDDLTLALVDWGRGGHGNGLP